MLPVNLLTKWSGSSQQAVQRRGAALQFAPFEFRADPEVAAAAANHRRLFEGRLLRDVTGRVLSLGNIDCKYESGFSAVTEVLEAVKQDRRWHANEPDNKAI